MNELTTKLRELRKSAGEDRERPGRKYPTMKELMLLDACIAISEREDGEPVAWIGRSTFSSGEEVDILAATEDGARGLSEERFRSALISPSITTIPLFARPPKKER